MIEMAKRKVDVMLTTPATALNACFGRLWSDIGSADHPYLRTAAYREIHDKFLLLTGGPVAGLPQYGDVKNHIGNE